MTETAETIPLEDQMYEAATFEEFWGYYQDIHASRTVRIAHAMGTTAAIGLIVAAIARRSVKLAIMAPMVDYTIAQSSHRSEGIRTKPYKKPLWHVRAELRLWRSTLRSMIEGRGGRREPLD
jgi:hypothetical protein